MDTHSAHLTGTNRSRSSQSPSPSHSASASATSSIHKRKLASEDHVPPFPPSFSAETRDGALTSNDDLESISARGGGADSDSDDDSDDAVVEDDEDDFDNDSSIRNFTAARLDNSGAAGPASASASASAARTTKIKPNATVKIENADNKDGVTAAGANAAGPAAGTIGNSTSGIVVKEDASKIFADSIQTSGAYISREESLKREVCFLVWTVYKSNLSISGGMSARKSWGEWKVVAVGKAGNTHLRFL